VNTIKEKRVKKEQIIALLVGISLILTLVLSGCSSGAGTTPTATVTVTATKTVTPTTTGTTTAAPAEKTYKVLNPQAVYVPVETKPCAPRLDSLKDKKILYYQSEANPVIMNFLWEKLKKEYPTSTFDRVYTEAFGESTPTADQLKYQACIRGISW
jgi:hypothetical protein